MVYNLPRPVEELQHCQRARARAHARRSVNIGNFRRLEMPFGKAQLGRKGDS
jgi:hypothetical protein